MKVRKSEMRKHSAAANAPAAGLARAEEGGLGGIALWKIALALYLFAQIFFLIGIQFPVKQNFDEFHYIPAAQKFFQFLEIPNREHPPLGKMIIAIGLAVLGDNPPGWRLMSTIFGAITLSGMFYWGMALFRDRKAAIWIALLTLVNQLLYVQSRIAMLDTFMMAFLVWGFAAFFSTWWEDVPERTLHRRLIYSGLLFGLAIAIKWFALMAWLSCIGMVVMVYLLKSWKVAFEPGPSASPLKLADWYSPKLWKGISIFEWFIYLGVIPFVVYFTTFLPYLFFQDGLSLWDLIPFQLTMYGDQLRVVSSHPYMSQWQQWPLMTRPIWYAFDAASDNSRRCVLLLGNPLIMWGGLLALLVCFWGFVRARSREGFLIFFLYCGLFGSWIVIPRKIAFYYYYYPAGMTLSLAWGYVFSILERREPGRWRLPPWGRWMFLGAATGFFIYFFPILSGVKIPAEMFRQYMWFSSWV